MTQWAKQQRRAKEKVKKEGGGEGGTSSQSLRPWNALYYTIIALQPKG